MPDQQPLRISISDTAEAELDDGHRFMIRFGRDVAEQWLSGIQAELLREAALQAIIPVRRPLAREAFPGRPVYVLTHRTRGVSPWRLLCELVDDDDDGIVDTLRVAGIRHAARSENTRSANESEDR